MDFITKIVNTIKDVRIILRTSIAYFSGDVLNKLVIFLVLPIFTRFLTPEDFGYLETMRIVMAVCVSIIGLEAYSLIVRDFFGETRKNIDKLISTNLYTGFFIIIILLILSVSPIGIWFSDFIVFPVAWLPIVLILSFFTFIGNTLYRILQAQQKPKLFVLVQLFTSITTVCIGLYLVVYRGLDWTGRFWATLIVTGLLAVFTLSYLKLNKLLIAFYGKKYLRRIALFGIPLIPHTIGGWLMTSVDRIYLNRLSGVNETGLYSIAFMFSMIVMFIVDSVNKAVLPIFFEKLQNINYATRIRIIQLTYLYDLFILSLSMVVSVVSYFLVQTLLPIEYDGVGKYLVWLCLVAGITGSYRMRSVYIIFTRKTYLTFFAGALLGGIVNIILIPVLIDLNGPIGAAQSTFVANLVMFAGMWIVSQKAYPMPWLRALRFGNLNTQSK